MIDWSCFDSYTSSQRLKIQADCEEKRTGRDHVQVFETEASRLVEPGCALYVYHSPRQQSVILAEQLHAGKVE